MPTPTPAEYQSQLNTLLASKPESGEEWAEICRVEDLVERSQHPDWGTPNYCYTCSPQNIGYCRCAIACNE